MTFRLATADASQEAAEASPGPETTAACIQATRSPWYERRRSSGFIPERQTDVELALAGDAVARRILAKGETLEAGQVVGVQLNLNLMRNTGVAVHTIHRGRAGSGHAEGRGLYRAEVIAYRPVVVLRDAFFNVNQRGREAIASGQMRKHPCASIDGTLVLPAGAASFDGVMVSFNPHRSHLFIDPDGYALHYAEHVTVMGHRAYVRGRLRYFTAETAPARAGGAVSQARVRSV